MSIVEKHYWFSSNLTNPMWSKYICNAFHYMHGLYKTANTSPMVEISRYFSLFLKMTSKLFWNKICKLIKFHLNKKIYLFNNTPNFKYFFPAYFSDVEDSALFQSQDKKKKIEYLRPTQFFQVHTIVYYCPRCWKSVVSEK